MNQRNSCLEMGKLNCNGELQANPFKKSKELLSPIDAMIQFISQAVGAGLPVTFSIENPCCSLLWKFPQLQVRPGGVAVLLLFLRCRRSAMARTA